MSMTVAFYVPDRHLTYDGRTVDAVGVGGGVTARIRLAAAMADLGCDVTMVCNCATDIDVDGVKYRRLGRTRLDADLLVLTTSGGDLDLSPAEELKIEAGIRLAWLHGIRQPKGLDGLDFDYLCGPSNFVTHALGDVLGIVGERRVVFYNALSDDQFRLPKWSRQPARDPFRLVYASHPMKGLQAAMGVLERLRRVDGRFVLHYFGGNQLWGEERQPVVSEGVHDHGLVGQRRLAIELQRSSFAISLQELEEAGPISLLEAMRAGAIVISSPVGAYGEQVTNGWDGFLIEGPHMSDAVQDAAAELILQLVADPWLAERVRSVARVQPHSWRQAAESWLGFARWFIDGKKHVPHRLSVCADCGGYQLALADGYHCTSCGRYRRNLGGPIKVS